MNWVDGVLWAVMALSGLWGLARGVVKEGFALLGWVLGFFASSAYASELVQRWPFVTWAEPFALAAGMADIVSFGHGDHCVAGHGFERSLVLGRLGFG